MPCTVSVIKKELIKNSLKLGKTAKQALLDANYTPSTAHNSTNNKCVKICQAELEQDIKKQITVESVLFNLKDIQRLAKEKGDFSTATRCEELIGKWLAMFTDRAVVDITQKLEVEEKQIIDKYIASNRIGQLM